MTTADVQWDADFEKLLTSVLPRSTASGPLAPSLDLKSVGLDSMATIELLVRLEDEYDVEFPEATLTGATFATPAALWAVLAAQRTAAHA
ncbi:MULTISPECIES: phosphopantetheine-binding protein [unclassified Streptomyces]|jgi:acyl carrier protein|uniref:phosphopantetheine-binding protein n=1 Tax=unclassified Streptomyces TaxID=2593676 RepID=UPI002E370A9B|nr:phosphopantetheine-binding protein [Streptomyces sp. NBC_01431]